jgi:hypothetical protein
MKVITLCDTPHYGHAPTYQIKLTYLERQKVMVRTSFAEKKKKTRGSQEPVIAHLDQICFQ